jgi:hypothetical protein
MPGESAPPHWEGRVFRAITPGKVPCGVSPVAFLRLGASRNELERRSFLLPQLSPPQFHALQ